MIVYALLDKKMGMFGSIMVAENDGHMARTLLETFSGKQHTIASFPEDFDLYQVGQFDGEEGVISSQRRFACNLAVIFRQNGGPDA